MSLFIHKTACCFYRKVAPRERSGCVLRRQLCLSCPMYIPKIEGLDLKEHVNVALVAITGRRTVAFSFFALVISLITLTLKIIETFHDEVKSLLFK